MRRLLLIVGLVIAATGCGGSSYVATVDGQTIDLDDLRIETEANTVPSQTVRIALDILILDTVLVPAAERDFGIRLDNADVDAWIATNVPSDPEQLGDPRPAADSFPRFARVADNGLLWPEVANALPEGQTVVEWRNATLAAADVEVNPRYGVWLLEPSPQVYRP